MNARDALREGIAALAGSGTPFLDASLLLGAALGEEPARLYAAGPEALPDRAVEAYRESLRRRSSGESVAYILGYREFWGRRFAVDGRVLVPRPDTELLVRLALEAGDPAGRELAASGRPLRTRVHEACCGSGCVALSVAAERPYWEVSASDLYEGALEVAAANAEAILGPGRGAGRPGGPVSLHRSDLLSAIEGPFDLVLANPPYVPSAEAEALLARGWREPISALDGGPDGLDLCRRLVPEAASRIASGGWLLVEADGAQAGELRSIFAASGLVEVETLPDLAGEGRVTRGRKGRAA